MPERREKIKFIAGLGRQLFKDHSYLTRLHERGRSKPFITFIGFVHERTDLVNTFYTLRNVTYNKVNCKSK